MTEATSSRNSVRAAFSWIFGLLILIAVVQVFLTRWGVRLERELDAGHRQRYESSLLAEELRQSSDDLTRMARTYVVTGDPRFEQYFGDILEIRDGKKPRPEGYEGIYWDLVIPSAPRKPASGPTVSLEERMRRMGFSQDEMSLLQESKRNSDALTRLERTAMNAVKGLYEDERGEFTQRRAPDLELAGRLLHSPEYHQAKAAIMKPLEEFRLALDHRTAREVTAVSQQLHRVRLLKNALNLATIAFVIGSFLVLHQRVMRPVQLLVEAARRLGRGDRSRPVPLRRGDEMGELGRALNQLSASVSQELATRKQTEEKLEEQLGFQRALLDTIPYPLIVKDAEGRFVGCNRANTVAFGQTTEFLRGKTVLDLEEIPEEARRRTHAQDLETIHSLGRLSYELPLRYQDGQEHATIYSADSFRLPDGRPGGLIALLVDISDQKRAQKELEIAHQEADAANQAKSVFLATMSHEIRTPMNAVINMTALALETALDNKQRQYLGVAHSSARGLLALINDILDFSKIEAGRMDLERAPFSLRGLLEEVTDSFRGLVLEKRIEFVVFVGLDVPDQLLGDSLRLRQVLINLVGNAFKFTKEGEVVLRVGLEKSEPAAAGEPSTAVIRFSVRDTGIGIPPDRLGQLFQAFSQVDASTSRRFGGTGLGLAICRRLVELMGGAIEVRSDGHSGSEFFFAAPFHFTREQAAVENQLPAELDRVRALVVEDNPSSQDLLRALFASYRMESDIVATGTQAWERLTGGGQAPAGGYGLLVTDWLLPDFDGLELARRLRADPSLRSLPMILISAFAGKEEEAQAAAAGFSRFVPKPLTASSLLDAVMGALGLSATRRTEAAPAFAEGEFEGRHLLVAEDNEANQFVAREILARAGITLDIAENGRIAVEKALATPYDAILMDMQMPEMDGLAATRALRAQLAGRRLPIIALTANAMPSDIEKCLEAGMDDYVAKPIDRRALFRALRKWLPASGAAARPRPAAEGATSASDVDEAAPTLEGIEVAESLRRLGIPWSALRHLLVRFADGQGETVAALRVAVAAQDHEAARRHAHSLAGSAGNLGAERLRAAAKRLELAAQEKQEGSAALLDELEEELRPVLRSIESLRLKEAAGAPAAASPSSPTDRAKLQAALRNLKQALDEADPGAAADAMAAVRRAGPVPAGVEKLVDNYEFEEAAAIVSGLIS